MGCQNGVRTCDVFAHEANALNLNPNAFSSPLPFFAERSRVLLGLADFEIHLLSSTRCLRLRLFARALPWEWRAAKPQLGVDQCALGERLYL